MSSVSKDQRYYKKHRDKLLAKLKTKIKCECGQLTTISNIYNHKKSKRHTELLKNNKKYQYCNDCNNYVKNVAISP